MDEWLDKYNECVRRSHRTIEINADLMATIAAIEEICALEYRARIGGHPNTVGIAEIKAVLAMRKVSE